MIKEQPGNYAPLTLFDFPDPVEDSTDSKTSSIASPQRLPFKSASRVKFNSMKAPKKSREHFGVTMGIGDFEKVKEEVEAKPTKVLIPYLKSKLRLSKVNKKEASVEEEEDDDMQMVKRVIKPSVPSYRKNSRPSSAAFPKENPQESGESLKTMLFTERITTPATMSPAPNFANFAMNRPKSAFPKAENSKPQATQVAPPSTLSKSSSLKMPNYKPGKTIEEIRKYEQAKEKAQHTVKQWLQEADQVKEVQVNRVTETMKKLQKEDLKLKQDITDIMKRFQDRRASTQHAVTRLRAVLKTKGEESKEQLAQHSHEMQTFKTELKMLYNDSAKPILKYPQLDHPVKSKNLPSDTTHPFVRDLEAIGGECSSIEVNMQLISDDDSYEEVEPSY